MSTADATRGEDDSQPVWARGPHAAPPPYHPPRDGPRVVHEDLYAFADGGRGGFVVVDKPAGLLSVPGIGAEKQDCARSRVLAIYPWATGPMTVHRLDRLTSGALIIALDAFTQRHFSMEFERRRVRKTYLALVDAVLPVGRVGCITVPMRKDLTHPVRQIVDFDRGRPAETHYEVLGVESRPGRGEERTAGGLCSRVRFEPRTGRTHQLRLHAADPEWPAVGTAPADLSRGLCGPIVGDELYGRGVRAGQCAADDASHDAAARLYLHAETIEFRHPLTHRLMGVRVPAPF